MALCLGSSYHGKDSLIIEIVREETSEKTSKPYHLGIGRNFFYNIKKPLQNPAQLPLGGRKATEESRVVASDLCIGRRSQRSHRRRVRRPDATKVRFFASLRIRPLQKYQN